MIYREKQIVKDASSYLAQTAATLDPVAICTPINLTDLADEWKRCAITNHFFCPSFRYDRIQLGRAAIIGNRIYTYWNKIRYNCTPQNDIDRAILEILEHRVHDTIMTSEMASSICCEQDHNTQTAILNVYEQPSNSFIMHCHDSLEHSSEYYRYIKPRFDKNKMALLASKKYRASEIRSIFIKALDYYGFRPNWECILDPKVRTIKANDKTEDGQSRLVVPSRRAANGAEMAILIGHEIESHIRGSENSRYLMHRLLDGSPLELLVNYLAKSDDERFYEGVAKISDVTINGNPELPSVLHTIAIDLALNEKKNFGEVANIICALSYNASTAREVAANAAWNITSNVFRGATNTNVGFAFTKDYDSLFGYEIATEIPASYHDYSSMTLDELRLLETAGVDLSTPRFPRKDAIKDILGA